MRFLIVLTLAALAFAAPASALAPGDFQYSVELVGPFRANAYYKAVLPDGVLTACAPGLADLRLLPPGGGEARYVVVDDAIPGATAPTYRLAPEAFEEGSDGVTLVYRFPDRATAAVDRLDLDIPDRDFRKKVTVETPDAAGGWAPVATGSVYDFSSQVDLRRTHVDLPAAVYTRLRLRLVDADPAVREGQPASNISLKFDGLDFSATKPGLARIKVDNVTAHGAMEHAGEVAYEETRFPAPALAKEKEGETSLVLRIGLPFQGLRIECGNAEFVRAVRVLGAASPAGPFSPLGRGSLSDVNLTGEHERRDLLHVAAPRTEWLKLVFEDRSSPPLAVTAVTVRRVRQALLFVADADWPALTLAAGCPTLARPDYDLAGILTQSNWYTAKQYQSVVIPPLVPTANYAPPVSEDAKAASEKALLTLIVALIVVALGVWLFKLVANGPLPPPDGSTSK